MLNIIEPYEYLFLVAILFSAGLDVKYKEIPLWFFPMIYAMELPLIRTDLLRSYLLYSLLIFGILFAAGMLSNLGGADALAGIGFGLSLGYNGLIAMMLSFFFVLPYTIYMKVKRKEHSYPFLPFMAAGYLTILVLIHR